MFDPSPDGYFANGLLLLTSSDTSGAAQGFEISLPDFAQASPGVLNTVQDQLRLVLRSAPEHQRLQFQWVWDSDYGASLARYHHETDRADNPWVRRCRSERVER